MSEGASRFRTYLLITVVYLFWGSNFVISKFALNEMPSPLAAGMRALLAGALLYAVYRVMQGEGRPPLRRDEIPRLALLGVFGISVNQVCFLAGLSITSASHAAIVIGMTPFMVLFLAWLRGTEVFTWKRVVGLCVAVVGVLILQKPSPSAQSASLIGDLLILGAGASFSYYTVYGKELAAEHGAMAVLSVSFLAGGILLLPVTLYFAKGFDFGAVSTRAWLSFGYMTVVSSVLCSIGWAIALKRVTASRISAFSYLQPLVATLMAIPMLGEPITATLVGGGSLIMAGVYLSERA